MRRLSWEVDPQQPPRRYWGWIRCWLAAYWEPGSGPARLPLIWRSTAAWLMPRERPRGRLGDTAQVGGGVEVSAADTDREGVGEQAGATPLVQGCPFTPFV